MATATAVRRADRYAKISEGILERSSWIRSVARTDAEGAGAKAESVKFFVHTDATVGSYVPGTGLAGTLAGDQGAYVSLAGFKEEAVNEIIDGFDAESAPEDFVLKRLEAAMLNMGKTQDVNALTDMIANGTGFTGEVALTKDNIYAEVIKLKSALDSAKAPAMDRYLICDVTAYNLLLQDSNFLLQTDTAQEIKFNGEILRGAGFWVIMEPSMPAGTSMVAVQKRGYGHCDEFKYNPQIVSLDGSANFIGDSALKARNIYVQGVLRAPLVQVYETV